MALLKKLAIGVLLFIAALLLPRSIAADNPPCSDSTQECAQKLVDYYQQQVNNSQNQEKTLSGQIDYMNTQIQLTLSKISLTEQKLGRLSDNISSVSGKIVNIQNSLTDTTKALIARVVSTYKQGQGDQLSPLLFSPNFDNAVIRLEYMKIVQKHDKELLEQMALTKQNYQDQKQFLEKSKEEQEALRTQLKNYQDSLAQQKTEKENLLSATRNDEVRYQQLLAEAKAQLAAFQSFVSSQGGVTLIDADPGWPHDYYSQRDKRWGNMVIAGPNTSGQVYTIGSVGCLITSAAMTLTHRGSGITPPGIAGNGSYFFDAVFLWDGLRSLGFNTPQRTLDHSAIDNALNQGKWAIIGLSYSPSTSSQPFHFVVVTSKDGGSYKIFDPWRGPNLNLNDNYGGDYITEVITY